MCLRAGDDLIARGHRIEIAIQGDLYMRSKKGKEWEREQMRGASDRDLGVAFQTHPGRQAFISSGGKEPRSALESRRVSLGAHWVDSRESSLLRRLERGREIGR